MNNQQSKPRKPRDIKIHVNPKLIEEAKNLDGVLGSKCNNCGGFGFTMSLGGGKLDCLQCEKTGVVLPSMRQLQTQVSALAKDIDNLRKIIIKMVGSVNIEDVPNGE